MRAAGKSAVDAAALQEHLLQQLNLGDALTVPFRRPKPVSRKNLKISSESARIHRGRGVRPAVGRTSARPSGQSRKIMTAGYEPRTEKPRYAGNSSTMPDYARTKSAGALKIESGKLLDSAFDLWQCESCNKLNPPTKQVCRLCSKARAAQFKTAPAVKMSLAQRRGLVALPASRLSDDEWVGIEQGAVARGMAEQDCPVCMDPLGLRDHLITSCGHLFHTVCLVQFERFSRQPASNRTCPVCR